MFDLKKRKGSTSVGQMPTVLLTFAIVGIIGVFVFVNVFDALPPLTGDANTAVEAFATNYYSGVNLLGVALIVLGAVTIIGIVGMLQRSA